MLLEVNNFLELRKIQPTLNTFFSKKKFPSIPIIFGLFPSEEITVYSKYNNYISPEYLKYAEPLKLRPPNGIAALFLSRPYVFNSLEELGILIIKKFKEKDFEELDYGISTRAPRYDLHALDGGGSLLSIYCQGLSLDFIFKPLEGIVQVASTKNIQFKKDNRTFMYLSLFILKDFLT